MPSVRGEGKEGGVSRDSAATTEWEPSFLLHRGRWSGILMHPTSLPGGSIGEVGAPTHRFIDWLAAAGQSCWQILPLVDADEGGSPYNGLSATAGNPLLIDLEELVQEGLLLRSELASMDADSHRVDFARVGKAKTRLLATAYARFQEGASLQMRAALEEYRDRNRSWLEDYALFRSLRNRFGGASWSAWPAELRRRDPAAIRAASADLADDLARCAFQQFIFDRQWAAVRAHAHARHVAIIGDIPIFVSHDSADVWANQELFQLRADGSPKVVSGVPPDYFSATGQRWGNPLYRWDVMRERGYDWWVERFRRTLEWVDIVRIDHFRGFEAYWEIPAEEETAVHGSWEPGPGAEFFRTVQMRLGELPVIAEDLGLITPEVDALRAELGYPGMRVAQFAFDGDPLNPHLPENYPKHTVAYTGTHDNDTIVGWWRQASASERAQAAELLSSAEDPVSWPFLELVFQSRARLAVAPLQDVLGLGSEARMNTPGTSTSNWTWRLGEGVLSDEHGAKLRELTCAAGRCASDRLPEAEPDEGLAP